MLPLHNAPKMPEPTRQFIRSARMPCRNRFLSGYRWAWSERVCCLCLLARWWPRDRTGRSGGVSSAVQSSHPKASPSTEAQVRRAIGPRRWLIQRVTHQQPNQPARDVKAAISFLSRSISAACSKHNFIVLTINSYSMFPLALNTYMLGFCML